MWPFKKKIEIERPAHIEVRCRHIWEALPVNKDVSVDQYECEWCDATVPVMEIKSTTKRRCKKCGGTEVDEINCTMECLGAFVCKGDVEDGDRDCVCLRCYEIAPDMWKKEYRLRKGFQTLEEKLESKDL